MTKTQAYGYLFESTQRELSNEYQHDRVSMVFKYFCVFALWMKIVLALEGLRINAYFPMAKLMRNECKLHSYHLGVEALKGKVCY